MNQYEISAAKRIMDEVAREPEKLFEVVTTARPDTDALSRLTPADAMAYLSLRRTFDREAKTDSSLRRLAST
ncbi:hypothetical protein [Paraburkholderia sediminicola]|uniref:hypothetical protein n=1 Tax=Paraburkholderia sediminicola TaxID=458836 RepID=UPI0038B7EC3D